MMTMWHKLERGAVLWVCGGAILGAALGWWFEDVYYGIVWPIIDWLESSVPFEPTIGVEG